MGSVGMSRRACDERGTTALEFALTATLLLMLLFGIIEFGRAIWLYQGVSAASREAARYGISNEIVTGVVPRYLNCDGMRAAAKDLTPDLGLTDAQIQIGYQHPGGATGVCDAAGDVVNGSRVQVTVSRPMDVNLPFVPLSVTISATDERGIYNGVDP